MGRGAIPTQVQVLAAGVFALVAVVFGYAAWDRNQRGPIIITTDPTLVTVVVEVRGEVVEPGVYTLPEDGRVGQLIEMAGGVTAGADLGRVNLARRLADGEQVVIPAVGMVPSVTGSPVAGDDAPEEASGLLNVNTASAAELETLPGIGEVLAGRIVAHREVNGPYLRVEDLTEVEGISEGVLDELRDLITVGP